MTMDWIWWNMFWAGVEKIKYPIGSVRWHHCVGIQMHRTLFVLCKEQNFTHSNHSSAFHQMPKQTIAKTQCCSSVCLTSCDSWFWSIVTNVWSGCFTLHNLNQFQITLCDITYQYHYSLQVQQWSRHPTSTTITLPCSCSSKKTSQRSMM